MGPKKRGKRKKDSVKSENKGGDADEEKHEKEMKHDAPSADLVECSRKPIVPVFGKKLKSQILKTCPASSESLDGCTQPFSVDLPSVKTDNIPCQSEKDQSVVSQVNTVVNECVTDLLLAIESKPAQIDKHSDGTVNGERKTTTEAKNDELDCPSNAEEKIQETCKLDHNQNSNQGQKSVDIGGNCDDEHIEPRECSSLEAPDRDTRKSAEVKTDVNSTQAVHPPCVLKSNSSPEKCGSEVDLLGMCLDVTDSQLWSLDENTGQEVSIQKPCLSKNENPKVKVTNDTEAAVQRIIGEISSMNRLVINYRREIEHAKQRNFQLMRGQKYNPV